MTNASRGCRFPAEPKGGSLDVPCRVPVWDAASRLLDLVRRAIGGGKRRLRGSSASLPWYAHRFGSLGSQLITAPGQEGDNPEENADRNEVAVVRPLDVEPAENVLFDDDQRDPESDSLQERIAQLLHGEH